MPMKTTLAHRLALLAATLLAAGCQQIPFTIEMKPRPVATETKPQPVTPQITDTGDRAAVMGTSTFKAASVP